MNKSEIAGLVAGRTGIERSAAGDGVDAVFGAIAETLARGEDVRIVGFGTFGTRSGPARTGRNPRTGESLNIAALTTPTFKAGKPLRDAVNAGGLWWAWRAIEDKRGLEGPRVEFGRLLFEDSARSGASAVLRKLQQG